MQLKRAIAAGALGALMAGSTLAFAASLSDFPAPFVSGGVADFLVVVGNAAAPSDVVGAIDVAARLGGAPVVKETVQCPGVAGGVPTNGVRLDTANTKIRLGDTLNSAKETLTATDLPSVLASGAVLDNSGNEYKYDQYVTLGSSPKVLFANPGTTPTTPVVVLDAQSTANNWYTAKVVFQKTLTGTITSGSSTSLDGKPIKLFGQEFTLGSGTTELSNTTITLYGGGTEVGLDWAGTPVTQSVTVSGKTVSVTLNGISTSNEADLTIDGTSYLQTAGSYITTASGVRIYIKSSIRYGQGGTGRVVLKVGADKIKLTNGQSVKVGSTEESVQGTAVRITQGTPAVQNAYVAISKIEIDVAPANSDVQKIASGSEFTDPVFKSFKLRVDGVSPSLDATTRDTIKVSYSGDTYVQATFTDHRGIEKTMTIGNASTSAQGVTLSDGTYAIHVAENDTIARNEYTIINKGGFSHILQYTTNDLTASTPSVTLRDVLSNTDYKVYLSPSTWTGTTIIDGNTFFVRNLSDSIQVHRGDVLRTGGSSDPFAVYAPIRLKNGEELVLTKPVTLAENTFYQVPGNTTVGGEGWYTFNSSAVNGTTFLAGTVNYTVTGAYSLFPTGTNMTGASSVGVVVIEEKDAATTRNSIVIPVSQGTGTPMRISVDAPIISGTKPTAGAGMVSTSDSYVTKQLDVYGALVTRQGASGTGQYFVTVSYPDDQIVADLMLGGLDMVVSGGVAGQTVEKQTVSPIKTMVGKLDTEFLQMDAASQKAKNVISIGGPCVNQVTAQLLGKTYPACGVESGLTENTALIKLVENAFGGSKVALVVAGWEAVNTRAATSALQNYENAGLTGTEKVL